MGALIQREALLIIANMSQDLGCLNSLVTQNGIKLVVDYLTMDYGDQAAFSAGRIVGNLTRILGSDPEKGKTVLDITVDAGAVARLVALLPLAVEPELKFNVCSALASLSAVPSTVNTLRDSNAVNVFVQLLAGQVDERIKAQVVTVLR